MPKLPSNLTLDQVLEAVEADDNLGFCLSCGGQAYSVEPDARKHKCETCGEYDVYGAEELMIMFNFP